MPVIPAIGLGLQAAGMVGSAAGGKKAQKKAEKAAQQQLQLQQNQFGMAKKQTALGNQALTPASQYFQSLLKGGQAARVAVSPMAQLIGQAGQGANTAIQAGTPRGGEQNLALAQNRLNTSGQIANLYTGVQPMAAQGLMGIGGEYFGSGANFNPSANTGAAMGQYGLSQQLAGQAGGGYGANLFQLLQQLQNRPKAPASTGIGATPPFFLGIGSGGGSGGVPVYGGQW